MRQFKRPNSEGFTLVELLISTTVFSVILIAATTSIVQVSRMYSKGIIQSRTQQATRNISDEIVQSIQFSNDDVRHFGPVNNQSLKTQVLCVGTTRYTYVLNLQQNSEVPAGQFDNGQYPLQIKHSLWKDMVSTAGECQDASDPGTPNLTQDNPGGNGTNGKSLLAQGMRLISFDVTQTANPNLFAISTGVIYGDNDLLLPNDTNPQSCKGSAVGGQWCAVSMLYTQAWKRVE